MIELRRVLMVSGSTRAGSTNSALCRTAAAWPPEGVEVVCFDGLTGLPHFDPDNDVEPLPPPVAALRAAVAEADAVVFTTPEYAGTLPGSFKNLLDWLVGGIEIQGKRAAWLNAAADPHRGGGAHASLVTVLGYVGAEIVEEACRHVPVNRSAIRDDGLLHGPATREAIAAALHALF